MNHGANTTSPRTVTADPVGTESGRSITSEAISLVNRILRDAWLGVAVMALGITGCNQRATPSVTTNSPPPTVAVASNEFVGTVSIPKTPTETQLIILVPITNMVPIRPGSFQRVKAPVKISHGYWLSKYEVTQGEFEALMGRNPSNFKGDSRLPVEKVSFFDAEAYCAALTKRERDAGRLPQPYAYRLPTEAEWEYACRAGTTNRYSFGDSDESMSNYGWTTENAEGTTHPVGQKQPNPWGLHDMHGNVWEWCLDWFGDYPTEPETDPVGPMGGKYKLFRGGSWNHDNPFARSGNRFMMSPSNGIHFVGFRVALGVPPPAPYRPAQVNQPTAPQRRN